MLTRNLLKKHLVMIRSMLRLVLRKQIASIPFAVSGLDVFYLAEHLSFQKNHKVSVKMQVLLTKELHKIIKNKFIIEQTDSKHPTMK